MSDPRDAAKILVVDDVALNVKLLARPARGEGLSDLHFRSGREAQAELEANTPDLVLLDVMMPGMSGYEVCQTIRANPSHAMLPVVLVTALDPAQERRQGLDAGADDFLNKPVNQAELLARVRSLLRVKSSTTRCSGRGELAEWNRTLSSASQSRSPARERGPAEALLLAGARRADRCRRRRGPAEEPPARDHGRPPRPSRLHRVHRDRGSRRRDGVLGEFPRRDRQALLRSRRNARRFTGDGIMIFFTDPVTVADPPTRSRPPSSHRRAWSTSTISMKRRPSRPHGSRLPRG